VTSAPLCPAPTTTNRFGSWTESTLVSSSLLCRLRSSRTMPSACAAQARASTRFRARNTAPVASSTSRKSPAAGRDHLTAVGHEVVDLAAAHSK